MNTLKLCLWFTFAIAMMVSVMIRIQRDAQDECHDCLKQVKVAKQ